MPPSRSVKHVALIENALNENLKFTHHRPASSRHSEIQLIVAEVETHYDDGVGENQDAAFEVIALTFRVHVREQEDTEDNGHQIPLREDEREHMIG